MQFPGQKPPAGVLFDSDLGNRIDSVLALALLYGFDGRNEVRAISVSVSKSSLHSAALAEVIGRFYAGAPGFFGRTLPVGMSVAGKSPGDTPLITVPLSAYPHSIEKLNDTAEVPALLRNALTAQHDQNAIVVMAGPATNVVTMLDLPGVKELIERKVRYLAVAAGEFPEGGPEGAIAADVPAAKKLFAEWPGPVVVCGKEAAAGVAFPGESIEKDFAWAPAHPVVDAYRAGGPMPYDAPAWDMLALLCAVRPQEGYLRPSDPGRISVLDDGRTRFAAAAGGKHRYLIADPAQRERIVKTLTEVASAKPVQRTRPGRKQP